MIGHIEAQRIAQAWHGGGHTPLYQFASTGAIVIGVIVEVNRCIKQALAEIEDASVVDDNIRQLTELREYFVNSALRDPVEDWYDDVIVGEG